MRLFLAVLVGVGLYDVLKHFYIMHNINYPDYPKKFHDFQRSENISYFVDAVVMLNIIIYLSINAIRDFRNKYIGLWPMFIISFIAGLFALGLRFLSGFQFDQMSINEVIFTIFSLVVTFYLMVHDYIILFWIKRSKKSFEQ